MPTDLIRYDLLVQEALKDVVRKVLTDAARDGLPGEHHFYVSFRTNTPGVKMSTRLRERYPQDMTIVLQHQFWDLTVGDAALEVGLSFSGVPERLYVPYEALSGFFDPSVQFGLKFEPTEDGAVVTADADAPSAAPEVLARTAIPQIGPPAASEKSAEDKPAANKDADVVSLDAFRKKS